jgi:hypothetical protein
MAAAIAPSQDHCDNFKDVYQVFLSSVAIIQEKCSELMDKINNT